jgi:hypothetical protein
MQRHEIAREGGEPFLADDCGELPFGRLVELVEQPRLELLGLDDLVDAVHPAAGAPDPGVVPDENEAPEPRLHRDEPEPLWRAHDAILERALEQVDMTMVLLDGGGDAALAAIPPARPLAVLVDRDAFGKRLALADPDLGESIDDQVIDLRCQPVDLNPQVVDRRPVLGPPEVQLDVVGGIALRLLAGADLVACGPRQARPADRGAARGRGCRRCVPRRP